MKSLSLSQPHVLIMVGIPGSGKSFFAEKFAETFNAPYLNRAAIVSIAGTDTHSTNELLYYQLGELLKTNQSIIVDGPSDTRTERAELSAKARKAGYEPLFIWVQTDPITAKARSTKDKSPTALSANEREQKVSRFVPPESIEKTVVISGKHTYASQAKVVLKKLSAPRAKISTHTTPPARTEPASGRRNITIR